MHTEQRTIMLFYNHSNLFQTIFMHKFITFYYFFQRFINTMLLPMIFIDGNIIYFVW